MPVSSLTGMATPTVVGDRFLRFLFSRDPRFPLSYLPAGWALRPDTREDQRGVLAVGRDSVFLPLFIGFVLYGACHLIGVSLFRSCLRWSAGSLALISQPTLSRCWLIENCMRQKRISTQIEGESLFNDGLVWFS